VHVVKDNDVLHYPITHLRILADDSNIKLNDGDYGKQFACGEEIPLIPRGREVEAEVVCERCAKERGYRW